MLMDRLHIFRSVRCKTEQAGEAYRLITAFG